MIVEPPCLMLGDRKFFPRRAHDPERIEAAVLVEPAIFGGQKRCRHVRRHPAERDELAVLDRERPDLVAVGREHDRLAIWPVVEQLRQIARQLVVDLGDHEVQRRRAERDAVDDQEQQHAQHRDALEPAQPALAARDSSGRGSGGPRYASVYEVLALVARRRRDRDLRARVGRSSRLGARPRDVRGHAIRESRAERQLRRVDHGGSAVRDRREDRDRARPRGDRSAALRGPARWCRPRPIPWRHSASATMRRT